jgi:hypothetical protein
MRTIAVMNSEGKDPKGFKNVPSWVPIGVPKTVPIPYQEKYLLRTKESTKAEVQFV